MKNLAAFVILLFVPACSLLGSSDGDLTAGSHSNEVVLRNGTSERVYFFVVGRLVAARINWIQSLDRTNSVAPGGERRIPYDEIYQEDGGEQEAIVYWWQAKRKGDAEKPGALNAIVIELN